MELSKKELEAIQQAEVYDVDTKKLHTQEELLGDWLDEKCPKCGATLLGNKRGDKWCSNAGGTKMSACAFGLGVTSID